jgi:hypothetical protein
LYYGAPKAYLKLLEIPQLPDFFEVAVVAAGVLGKAPHGKVENL